MFGVQQHALRSHDKSYLILQVCFVLMPRKKIKIKKEPLRFLERPAGEARVHHNVPDVRAALNPKDFFTEAQEQSGSSLNSWVSPQFDTSTAAPVKRQRGKLSSSSQGNFTPLSRKSSVCSKKFPTLLFKTKGDCHQKQRKNILDNGISSSSNGQGPSQKTNTIHNVHKKRTIGTGLLQKDDIKSRYGNSKKATSLCQTRGRCCISSDAPSSYASEDCAPVDIISPQPNLVTPKISEDYSSTYSKPLNFLWSPLCTPSSNCTVDILIPDTPERDYGVKVTWRRRRKLMLLLKERGHLSDSEAVIHA